MRILEHLIQTQRLSCARIRARWLRFRGADVAKKVSIGTGCRFDRPWNLTVQRRVSIEHNVWIKIVLDTAQVSIGEFTFLGNGTEADVAHSLTIGRNALIAPRVFFVDHNHNISPGRTIVEQGCNGNPIVIEDDVWIGTGAVILPGVTIGTGAVVGAGAVVRRSIPPGEIWAGVPAKKIGVR